MCDTLSFLILDRCCSPRGFSPTMPLLSGNAPHLAGRWQQHGHLWFDVRRQSPFHFVASQAFAWQHQPHEGSAKYRIHMEGAFRDSTSIPKAIISSSSRPSFLYHCLKNHCARQSAVEAPCGSSEAQGHKEKRGRGVSSDEARCSGAQGQRRRGASPADALRRSSGAQGHGQRMEGSPAEAPRRRPAHFLMCVF